MCGRYTLRKTGEIQARFLVNDAPADLAPRYNIAPSERMPVIVQHEENRKIEVMSWGLVPSWSKEPKPPFSTFNARAEGIAEKPAFRLPIRRRRCLIPADGFYEWGKTGSRKQPYFIHMRDDRLFAFAGLYDIWHGEGGQEIISYTIITGEPNDVIAPLHNRMAVILRPEDEAEWLDPGVTDPFQVTRLLKPYPADEMDVYPVSSLVNRAGYDTADMVAPMA